MKPTVPCDFCGYGIERDRLEGTKVSHAVRDSSGNDLVAAEAYFVGHPACIRAFYRNLVERKLDLFKYPPKPEPVARASDRR